MSVRVDERDWPLVRVRYAGEYTMTDVESFWRDIDRLLGRGERFAMITDGQPTGRGRGTAKAQMAFFQAEIERMGDLVAGTANVVTPEEKAKWDGSTGAARRKQVPYPVEAFLTDAEAVTWARARLGIDG